MLRFVRAILDPAAQVQRGRILPHPRADRVYHTPDALELIQPQHLALGRLIDRRKDRRAGQRIVSLDAHVELDAAAEPRVAQAQIARLKYRIDVQQFLALILVIDGIQPSAQLRQEHGAHVIVFHHSRLKRPGLLFPVVAVLQPVGQHGRNHALTDVFLFFLRHLVRHFIPGVDIADVLDVRHGVQRPKRGRGNHELFKVYHDRLPFSSFHFFAERPPSGRPGAVIQFLHAFRPAYLITAFSLPQGKSFDFPGFSAASGTTFSARCATIVLSEKIVRTFPPSQPL